MTNDQWRDPELPGGLVPSANGRCGEGDKTPPPGERASGSHRPFRFHEELEPAVFQRTSGGEGNRFVEAAGRRGAALARPAGPVGANNIYQLIQSQCRIRPRAAPKDTLQT